MSTDNPSGSTSAENRCQSCGSFVTKDFARVFGDNDDQVHGCLECMSASDVKRGGSKPGCSGSIEDTLVTYGRDDF